MPSKTRFRTLFSGLVTRCTNKNRACYSRYGGKGVRCEWQTFEDFKRDMHESYVQHVQLHGVGNTTIDRIDTNGNYSKTNCRWTTYKIQGNNKVNNHYLTFQGKTKTMMEWAKIIGINYSTLRWRIRNGWRVKHALSTKTLQFWTRNWKHGHGKGKRLK